MAGGSGKKGKKRQKNAQQSSQQNQDRPQTLPTESDFPTLGGTANPSQAVPGGQLPTESDFPTLGATPRGQVQDEFPALGGATRSPIPQAVAQTDEVQFQPQAAGTPYPGKEEEYWSCDPQHLIQPVCLAMGQQHLFVTSPSTNQVQVFQNGQNQGVLKINNSNFNSVRNVHTYKTTPNSVDQVVVLDDEGFHFFNEKGLYNNTILTGEGHKYRGSGHVHYQGKLYLVSLDVKNPKLGVSLVVIDIEKCSIIKRFKIFATNGLKDEQTKCRFLTVSLDEKKVYVTSLMLNKIFSIDLFSEEVKTFSHKLKEPAGIAIDPKNGTIFVSCRASKTVEIFNSDMCYLGQFLHYQDKVPIGLCVHDENIYVSTNENSAIMKVPIKYGARAEPHQIQPVDSLVKINTDQLVQGASALSLSQQNRNPSEQNIDFFWNRSGIGSFNNPYKNAEEKRKYHTGTKGRRVKILANHFPMSVKSESVFRYDVKFNLPWKRPVGKRDRPLLLRAIEEVKKKHANKEFPPKAKCVVFDGRAILLSPCKLGFDKSFATNVKILEDLENPERIIEIKINLEFVGAIPIKSAVEAFEQGRTGNLRDTQPNEAVQMLNIILSYGISIDPTRYEVIGRKYFQPNGGAGHVERLGGGKYLWLGTFESVRVGWKMKLNIDMANKPAYMKMDLFEFLVEHLSAKRIQINPNTGRELFIDDYGRITDTRAYDEASRELKDLKARFLRPDGNKRDYRMIKLVGNPKSQMFEVENGQKMSVNDYFKQHYKYTMKYPNLPCVQVGNPKSNIFLPLECLELKQQVCPQSKILGDDATRNMIKVTAVRPDLRQKRIKDALKSRNDAFKNDPYAQGFGISVQENFSVIGARILDPPSVSYGTQKKNNLKLAQPRDGKWRASSHFVSAASLNSWAVLDTANLRDGLKLFINALMEEARHMGMATQPPQNVQACRSDHFENEFRKLLNGKPSIIVVIQFDKSSDIYQKAKLIGDTEINIPTQFVLSKNATGRNMGEPPSPQTIHNIILKINSKLGGTNQDLAGPSRQELKLTLGQKETIFSKPIMFVGADVTHPAPDQMGVKPSIAAIVASIDPAVSRYICEVRVQFRGPDEHQVTEQILDMENVFEKLLKRFYKENQRKPERIIFYRDGVSEGQFEMVVNKEITALQRACYGLEKDYQPGITYFVAQKRHHTRLFPENPKDPKQALRNGNILPGTVVDTDIIHPTISSFFLASHEGIQGTTKPTYYVKLYDDNNLNVDVEQALTYYLCHLYSRCERSVSYPAPTYNAHLAAFRARDHHNALLVKHGHDSRNIPKKELENIQNLALPNYFV